MINFILFVCLQHFKPGAGFHKVFQKQVINAADPPVYSNGG
jgi:hypothetical protein